MTTTAKDKRIASRLECLPSELIEPILANLTFRNIIALSICAEDNCQRANALVISPAWKDIWPVYVARKSEFQTIMSNSTLGRRELVSLISISLCCYCSTVADGK